MQFIVTAYDYQDEEALNRRLKNREAHLASIEKMVKEGSFLSGGAILSKEGKMIGSSVHVEFNNRDELNAWIAQDPYVLGKVWDKIEISEGLLFPVKKFAS